MKLLCLGNKADSGRLITYLTSRMGFKDKSIMGWTSHSGVLILLDTKECKFTTQTKDAVLCYNYETLKHYQIFDIKPETREILKYIDNYYSKKTTKTENMEGYSFIATGSKPLMEALFTEIRELGVLTIGADQDTYRRIGFDKIDGTYKVWKTSISGTLGKEYILPKDYNTVLETVKKALEEVPKFKVGDWVWDQKYTGNVYKVISDREDGKNGDKIALKVVLQESENRWRIATKEEIEAKLIESAQKRGFIIGTKVEFSILDGRKWASSVDRFQYNPALDSLVVGYNAGGISIHDGNDLAQGVAGWTATIYRKGKWVTDVKPYTKTPPLLFGGKEVKIEGIKDAMLNHGYIDVKITSQGVVDYYSNMKRFKESMDVLQDFTFGTAKRDVSIHKKPIKDAKIKLGCTTGTIGEILAILDACEKLLNK